METNGETKLGFKMEPSDTQAPTISFGFSKRVVKKDLKPTVGALRDDSNRNNSDEVDFVTGIVGSKIQGTLKKPKIELPSIPLVQRKDGWVAAISQAIAAKKEIDAGTITADLASIVPKITLPGGSDSSTLDDYDRVPVANYGLTLLRGMGWKETEGIGLKNKGVVEIREPIMRPRGLGLGAERPQSTTNATPVNAKLDEKALTMKVGAYAMITRGYQKGSYGQIISLDEDNSRVVMKLAIGSDTTSVSTCYINLVDPEEFKKKSKVLNNDKYEEYKLKQDIKNEKRLARVEEDRDIEMLEKNGYKSSNGESFKVRQISSSRSPSPQRESSRRHKHHKSSSKRKDKEDKESRRRDDRSKKRRTERDYS